MQFTDDTFLKREKRVWLQQPEQLSNLNMSINPTLLFLCSNQVAGPDATFINTSINEYCFNWNYPWGPGQGLKRCPKFLLCRMSDTSSSQADWSMDQSHQTAYHDFANKNGLVLKWSSILSTEQQPQLNHLNQCAYLKAIHDINSSFLEIPVQLSCFLKSYTPLLSSIENMEPEADKSLFQKKMCWLMIYNSTWGFDFLLILGWVLKILAWTYLFCRPTGRSLVTLCSWNMSIHTVTCNTAQYSQTRTIQTTSYNTCDNTVICINKPMQINTSK